MPTTVLKSKEQIIDDCPLDVDEANPGYDDKQVRCAMDKYAEQNSIAFAIWRIDQSINIQNRHKLNRPIPEQYQLFRKENGL